MALSWLMIVLVLLPNKLHSQSDTTAFDFTGFDGGDPNLIFQGEARVLSHGTISLTPRIRNSVGRVLYSPPIRLWDRAGRRQANFQTVITGLIPVTLWGSEADGMSFFIAPVDTTIPTVTTAAGNMGLYDNSSGASPVPLFAVELDVFPDSWDPSYRHVGINLNSRNSVAVERWDVRLPWSRVEARITYDARERLISVYANASGYLVSSLEPVSELEPIIARVEHSFDLKTLLPEWVQIGISASTRQFGPAVELNVFGWSFISFLVSDDVNRPDDDNYIRQYV